MKIMTFEVFMLLLTMCSTLTSLCTEGVNVFLEPLNIKYSSNIIALIVAIFVGGVGTALFYELNSIEMTTTNIICIFLMMGANWLGAMVGYDKVKQAIIQLSGGKNNGN